MARAGDVKLLALQRGITDHPELLQYGAHEEEKQGAMRASDFEKYQNDEWILKMLDSFGSVEPASQEDLKVLALTWNMARTVQNDLDLTLFLPQVDQHDLVVLCFE